jgi:hypothetical protein
MDEMFQEHVLAQREFSIAMTEALDAELRAHLDKGPTQEDLAFALWRPSLGRRRVTAILQRVILPGPGDRQLHGNVAFLPAYIRRVLLLAEVQHCGVALLHSHLGPGWQPMSGDDVVAEQQRLAAAVAGRTGLPLVGLTRGTDGAWSGRFWLRRAANDYVRHWAQTVRVVGRQLRITYHPKLLPPPTTPATQVATVSVWGAQAQADLVRAHIGIVGLGSVGSMIAESLSRVGCQRFSLIDHDVIELRNLDRTLGAFMDDALQRRPKVLVAERQMQATHTAPQVVVDPFIGSLLHPEGLLRALDCDLLFSCVDRPWPRHLLNALAYAHLIPVVDGGIFAKVKDGQLLHADWRIHTVGPNHSCMVCLGALRLEDIALDREGKLDDPVYIQGLGPEFHPLLARQNVFPFSQSVAAHQVLQGIGLLTGQPRIGGIGAQTYHCYPGRMEVNEMTTCTPGCGYAELLASTTDLSGNCDRNAPHPESMLSPALVSEEG